MGFVLPHAVLDRHRLVRHGKKTELTSHTLRQREKEREEICFHPSDQQEEEEEGKAKRENGFACFLRAS